MMCAFPRDPPQPAMRLRPWHVAEGPSAATASGWQLHRASKSAPDTRVTNSPGFLSFRHCLLSPTGLDQGMRTQPAAGVTYAHAEMSKSSARILMHFPEYSVMLSALLARQRGILFLPLR
jgi:hypothetical protein